MGDAREARIIGGRCGSQEDLHAYVAAKLGFPDYYGANLSALADSLAELGEPARMTFCIGEHDVDAGMQAYLLRFVQVCAREALVNENLTLVVEHPRA